MRCDTHLFTTPRSLLRLPSILPTKAIRWSGRQRPWMLRLATCSVVIAVQVMAGGALKATALVGTAHAQPAADLAPVRNEKAPNTIPDQYIVVFKAKTARESLLSAQSAVKKLGGTILFTYSSALTGFTVKIPPEALQALRAIPGIDYIEPDQRVSVQTVQPPNPNTIPPTGLDRIDRRLLPLNQTYTYSETGVGVNAYVIDTGIDVAHVEFGGRASWAADFSGATPANTDCFGHGTHVAGILGGTDYGVAKAVTLHAVRVFGCTGGGTSSTVLAGVDWVTAHAIHPAVANMSLNGGLSSAEDAAVTASIASGVIYAIAAGNAASNACNSSPADVATGMTVGAIDPTTDTEAGFSNWGPCLKLFAPGVNIVSAMPDTVLTPGCTLVSTTTPNARSASCSGTSMAAPHVAGVAARYLQTHPAANPAAVFAAIHTADDIFNSTANWQGVVSINVAPQTGSPNEELHWGSVNNGVNDGDPHLITVDGIHYDFQGAGEYVALHDGNGLEIQTRQTPIATAPPAASPYTGLATCVSLNTAVAARVGPRRVTYEPDPSGVPDPTGLQFRLDGVLTKLPATGLNLGPAGRVLPSFGGVVEIDFPDGTNLTVTPTWWQTQSKWYLNLSVFNTTASEGLMGATAAGSWLPALPSGASLGPIPGPMPAASHQRFIDLYQKFGDAWRVTDATSLFDYAPGTSTATFSLASWPPESPPCALPKTLPPKPLDLKVARALCRGVDDKNSNANCVFDTAVTGEAGFAKAYLASQRIQVGATRTTLNDNQDTTLVGQTVAFIATVQLLAINKPVPTGTVQFVLDGTKAGVPIRLDSRGRVIWQTSRLAVGNHQVAAVYTPARGSAYLASTSLDTTHTVVNDVAKHD
jgi:subtilisin family serine protease